MSQPILRLEQVAVLHRLHDISCAVLPGERVGIVGSSGAGKSTLLQLLNRLQDPDGGQLYYQATPFADIPIQQLRRRIVLVLQEPKLLGMRVSEALAYPLVLQQRSPTDIQTAVEQWCDRLRIPKNWLERHEYELSVGQRQLVTIARALIMEPQVLLLDEPTSALDLGTANQMLQTLQSIPDLTWIMVNHQLEWVKQCCDRVLWLDQGRLQRDCTVTELDWEQLDQALKTSAEDWQ